MPARHHDGTSPRDAARTLLVSGASGLIGTALLEAAHTAGHTVRTLVRREPRSQGEFRWDPAAGLLDPAVFNGVDAVVNLSGSSISSLPWTAAKRREILASRVAATSTITRALHEAAADLSPGFTLLNASGVGVYGSRPGEQLTETSESGSGFLAGVCREWEARATDVPDGVRVVLLRTGLVLSPNGGVLPLMTRIARWGLAGPLGSGRQHWPCISLTDHVAAQLHLLTAGVRGPVNLAAPTSPTAGEVMRAIAAAAHRPYLLPAPAFALIALLGDAARELLLIDQAVQPVALTESGFTFRAPDVHTMLRTPHPER